jgi:hypothetical protein
MRGRLKEQLMVKDESYRHREYSGGCQCGAVRFHATALKDNPHVCHCRMCQKAMGNLFAALVGVRGDDLTWTRGTPATFRSSEHVDRGFCRDCGTPLFYRNVRRKGYGMTIGSFDEPHLIPVLYEMGLEAKHPSLPPLPGAKALGTTEKIDGAEAVGAIARTNNQHPDHDTDVWPPQGRAA